MDTCKTVSMCTPLEEDQGTHVFDILGYSKHMGRGHDEDGYIQSGTFSVGGYDWAILFSPDGEVEGLEGYISVSLALLSYNKLRASCDIRLVDQYTGLSSSLQKTEPTIFNPDDVDTMFAPLTPYFIRRSEIEGSVYLRDDRLTIECMVTVYKKPHVTETKPFPQIDVPPADRTDHVFKMLDEKKGFDVSLIVGGETIEAHRLVLAMRSPVLKEELYGPMWEARLGQGITIKNIQPAVFRALLHFMYTDSLPGDKDTEMVRLLLVAAERYAMDRLKLVCQSFLCEHLSTKTVVTTLALADQHNCHKLMDACLDFIKTSGDLDALLEKRRKLS